MIMLDLNLQACLIRGRNVAGLAVRLAIAIAVLAGATTLTLNLDAQAAASEQNPPPGDQPDNPGPLAHDLSGKLTPAAVKTAMRKVADWQLARVNHDYSSDWTYSTLYLGMLAASETLKDARYLDFVKETADHYQWKLGPRKTHADDHAIGQSYLWLYSRNPEESHIAPLRQQFDAIMQSPDDPQKPIWWWCDALFMAPPVWAQLAAVTHDDKYLAYMDHEWHITSDLLWDKDEHLFYRDSSFFKSREKNGAKVFWSRGNGWVMGGLVRVLSFIPQNDPFYVEKFRQMAEKVRSLQGQDGLWRPGLLDAADYPYPEISGSSFYIYAMAWGVNHDILDQAQYRPALERGWNGLISHIYADGRLGSTQPIGGAPDVYKPGSSYVFGVGAFLLAGSEVAVMGR